MFINFFVYLDMFSGKFYDSCRVWYIKYMFIICVIYIGLINNVVVMDWYIYVVMLDKNILDGLLY